MRLSAHIVLGVLLFQSDALTAWAQKVDFRNDIRPILSDACFHCHGPDESSRQADLRLDRRIDAQAVLGEADQSELLRRVQSSDPDEMMPPPDSGKSLSPQQVSLLTSWIKGGAEWSEHWSLVTPEKPPIPARLRHHAWIRQPFDAFVLEQLQREHLQPADEAPRHTLVRRLWFDLTGLPPSWDDVEAFVNSDEADAYEQLVDRLLDSKQFGERMAMSWLDAARYADTDGYQADATRTNWPWRDWVIQAFNDNMPFDQFTIEQFAGDLLPEATSDQVLATCFHRNHMTNGEGGRDPEESRVDYVIDRVNTMGTVWLGLTLGCTQCHSHKYDPISHAEYYQLNAFFNSIDEDGKAGSGAKPFLEYSSDTLSESVHTGFVDSQTWLARVQSELDEIERKTLENFDTWIKDRLAEMRHPQQFRSWERSQIRSAGATHGAELRQIDNGEITASGLNARHDDYRIVVRPKLSRITGMRLSVLPEESGNLAAGDSGHFILTSMKINVGRRDSEQFREIKVGSAVADYEKEKTGRSYGPVKTVLDDDPRSGWTSLGADPTEERTAVFGFDQPIYLDDSEFIALELRHRSLMGYANVRRFTVEFTDERGPALASLDETPFETLAKADGALGNTDDRVRKALQEQFLLDSDAVTSARDKVAQAESRHQSYGQARKPIKVMVLSEREEPRKTHLLQRGVWDKKGEEVQRGVPAALPVLRTDGARATRLDLAKWLVSDENPLTARVTVNRLWQMLFGYGLVRTPDDFGTQGQPPTHPRVLDWLAVELMQAEWDLKHVIKRIVMSATYRQSSYVSATLQQRDPENRLLARNARFRLSSWMIRDAMLKAAGLLDDRLGGPPVYPLQPPGAWADATMGRFHYRPSVGGDRYRRTLYTFWRRSVAPTGLFDTSKRRNCEVREIRTNTPLHALNLLNDETYVEAARVLATRAIDRQNSPSERVRHMFRTTLSRDPSPNELEILLHQLDTVRSVFSSDKRSAARLCRVGQAEVPEHISSIELATYATVASSIFNLDEAISRE